MAIAAPGYRGPTPFRDGGSNGAISGSNKSKMAAAAILENFKWPYLRNGSRSTYSAHRAVIFAIAQLSCNLKDWHLARLVAPFPRINWPHCMPFRLHCSAFAQEVAGRGVQPSKYWTPGRRPDRPSTL